jgi:hypothetical protein
MTPDRAQISTLSAMISRDLEAIRRLDSELVALAPSLSAPTREFRDVAAAAYVLHNIYNALENIFEQVSRTYENHITDPAQWHRELLTKMFLEIPKIRPAVLPTSQRAFLNDLRGFRHLFRHTYEFELDPEKLSSLVRSWYAHRDVLLSALGEFRDALLRRI